MARPAFALLLLAAPFALTAGALVRSGRGAGSTAVASHRAGPGSLTAAAPVPPVTAAAAVPPASAAPAAARPARRPMQVLFVGASITAGWFASSSRSTFPADVIELLGRRGRRAIPFVVAVPGARAETAATWRILAGMDAVVVHIVTNDFAQAVGIRAYRRRYGLLLDRVRAADPGARLVCLGAWAGAGARNRLGLEARAYDAVTRRACAAHAGRYLDLGAVYANPSVHRAGRTTPYGRSDWMHPDDLGQRRIALLLVPLLDPG